MDVTPYEAFGSLLRRYRRGAGMTQEGLADRAGVSAYTISNIERGLSHLPHKETLHLLTEALSLTPQEQESFLAAARAMRTMQPTADAQHSTDGTATMYGRIPSPPTTLIGREGDLAAAARFLHDPNVRLLTLTGIGGVGKTRFAIDLARDAESAFSEGAYFIALAAVHDPALVSAVMAGALSLRGVDQMPFTELLERHLYDKSTLLLLDNFEHLLPAATLVSDLLAACPGLKILTTSRTPLRVRGEQEYPLSPLALPSATETASVAALATIASIDLFVNRSRMVRHTFSLDSFNAGVVAAICQRLDGLPLAIELAAARSKTFSPHALLARLDEALMSLLTAGPRDAPARQRTLRDTFAWSYGLLPLDVQAAFRRLAVFLGGWTLEAAEAVCAVGTLDADLPAASTPDRLSALVDSSLLQADLSSAVPRYSMLETVREYALELLCASEEDSTAADAHLAYFLGFAEDAEQQLQGHEIGAWVAKLEKDIGNLRAALAWAAHRRDAESGLRLAVALRRFWDLRGYLTEGRAWLERFLALAGGETRMLSPQSRARALNALGVLAAAQSDYNRAVACHEEALALRRELGDQEAIGSTLNNLALVVNNQGEYGRAEQLYLESLTIARSVGNTRAVTLVLNNLGNVAMNRGDYRRAVLTLEDGLMIARQLASPREIAGVLLNLGLAYSEQGAYSPAEHCLREALTLSRELGYRHGIAGALQNLGEVAYWQGDLSDAMALCQESLALLEELGERRNLAYPLSTLGEIARKTGDCTGASTLHEKSLAIRRACHDTRGVATSLMHLAHISRDSGAFAKALQLYRQSVISQQSLEDKTGTIACLEGLAEMLQAQAASDLAVQLCGAASAARAVVGVPQPPIERSRYDEMASALRSGMGEERFATAWVEGEALGLDGAIALLLDGVLEDSAEAK